MSARKKFDKTMTGSKKKDHFSTETYWISKKWYDELLLSYEFNIVPFSELKISFSCFTS